jgi:hypothetical protein
MLAKSDNHSTETSPETVPIDHEAPSDSDMAVGRKSSDSSGSRSDNGEPPGPQPAAPDYASSGFHTNDRNELKFNIDTSTVQARCSMRGGGGLDTELASEHQVENKGGSRGTEDAAGLRRVVAYIAVVPSVVGSQR